MWGLPRWLSGKESACQHTGRREHRFDPWVRKIPWRRKWGPTPVFLPGKSPRAEKPRGLTVHGGQKGSDATEHAHTQNKKII